MHNEFVQLAQFGRSLQAKLQVGNAGTKSESFLGGASSELSFMGLRCFIPRHLGSLMPSHSQPLVAAQA